jgi:hypothetical protein
MKINTQLNQPNVSFKYSHPLKTAYRKGLLPKNLKGLYKVELTQKNVSLEHGIPASLGGPTTYDNLFLADKFKNIERGTKPLLKVVTKEDIAEYLSQFIEVKNRFIDGMKYIKGICSRFDVDIREVFRRRK